MRSLSRSTGCVPLLPCLGVVLERRRSADRTAGLPADLRAGLGGLARGVAVEDLLEELGRQVLVGVLADLHHRGVGADAEALDLLPGEVAVLRQVVLLGV